MRRNPVVKEISDRLIPVIVLFGLYVQFHGDFGPGGGFQAGVIVAAGVVLYTLVYGVARTQALIPPSAVRRGIALGLLLYAAVGFACILRGGRFLEYGVLGATQLGGQHLGILLIELGVGITVAAVIVAVFYAFADQRAE